MVQEFLDYPNALVIGFAVLLRGVGTKIPRTRHGEQGRPSEHGCASERTPDRVYKRK